MALILVVDDNHLLAETIRKMLAGEGHEVLIAPDGRLALKFAREWRPDLVILDVLMPGMHGLEVCRELRRDRDLCQTPVLVLTAMVESLGVIRGLGAGADDYLGKPVRMHELLERINALLRHRGS